MLVYNNSDMNADTLRRAIQDQYAADALGYSRHTSIVETLRRHDGKKITRRLNTDLAKIDAHLSFRYGMIYVSFPKPGEYATIDHLLAYDSDPTVNLAKFEEFDACHGRAAVERNQQRLEILKTQKPEKAAAALARFKEAVLAFAADTADYAPYEVMDAAKRLMADTFPWRIS